MFFALRASKGSFTPSPSCLRRLTAAALSVVSLAAVSSVLTPTPASAKPPKTVRSAHVRVETARLRSGPGEHHKMAGLLDAGRTARVVGRREGWLKVRLASGTEGWVRNDLLRVSKKTVRDSSVSPSAARRRARLAQKARDQKEETRRERQKELQRRQLSQARESRASMARRSKIALAVAAAQRKRHGSTTPTAARKASVQVAKATPRFVTRPTTAAPRKVTTVAKAPTISAPVSSSGNLKALTAITRVAASGLRKTTAAGQVEEARLRDRDASLELAPDENPMKNLVVALAPPPVDAGDKAEARDLDSQVDTDVAPEVNPLEQERLLRVATAAVADKTSSATAALAAGNVRSQRLIRSALAYRGTPYRMGARAGSGAFDCSSFTQFVYAKSGVSLPRTASQQATRGQKITRDELRAGDLVFFKNTYKRGVSHVGIYVGDGKFVHASSRGGVRTNSLSEAYYLNHWAGGRRVN